ncbi:MAG: hypothetical protein GY947_20240 [Rhodobacteraceae bacterium]|nr:hypothetical protein [Paracoccaceae bacterium]
MTKSFAVWYEPGENWAEGKPIGEQELGDHLKYLLGLHDRGVVEHGGPFADGTAGLVVLNAEGIKQANEHAANDPAVRAGILQAAVREWRRIV